MCTNICFECINLFKRSFLVRTLPAYGNYMCLFTCTADLSLSKSFHGYFFLLLVLFFNNKKQTKKMSKRSSKLTYVKKKKLWLCCLSKNYQFLKFWNSLLLHHFIHIIKTLMNNMGKNVHIYYLSLVSVAFGLPGVLALLFLHAQNEVHS